MTSSTDPSAMTLDRLMTVAPAGSRQDVFVGEGWDYGPLRIYGGHLLGQALAAGLVTVDEPKLAHSLHAYFLRTGKAEAPIEYRVERVRDGRAYATRLIRAEQDGETLLLMTASFKPAEPGDEHQWPAPRIASPGELAAVRERAGRAPLVTPFTAGLSVELEPTDDWTPLSPVRESAAITLWMRAALRAAGDARSHQPILAYLSDGSMMFNALRPHGDAFRSHRATSLDHALWFHRPSDPGQWLLFDQSGPAAADSRGFNQGTIYDSAGTIIASVAQEGMMRRLDGR